MLISEKQAEVALEPVLLRQALREGCFPAEQAGLARSLTERAELLGPDIHIRTEPVTPTAWNTGPPPSSIPAKRPKMPSAVQKTSCNSVTVYWVDKETVQQALDRLVADCQQREEVLAVVLFGSLVEGGFGVGSDVDLLLILRESAYPFLDRIPLYQPDRFPVDVDVFSYTWEEIRAGHPLAHRALATGRVLWQREGTHQKLPPEGSS